MSVTDVLARVTELQAIAGAVPARTASPAQAPTAFADKLAAATAPASAPAPGAYLAEIDSAASRHGLDPAVLRGLIRQESGFDPRATSPAGAQGLAQLMPGTAAGLGVTDPYDPAQSIDGGARYLREQLDRFGGDYTMALAAYNAGPGAVRRHGGVPPYAETRNYVSRVLAYAEQERTTRLARPGVVT